MCLLVKVAPNTVFPLGWFEDCFGKNRDGIGLSYGDGKCVVVHKHLPSTAQEAMDWLNVFAPKNREYALHWRMRTHGAIDIERVHPYRVTDDVWLMHNGVLPIGSRGDTVEKSDTQLFAEWYQEVIVALLPVKLGLQSLGDLIGSSNRMIFIHADGRLQIANESTGMTTEKFPGCWFSNRYAWTPHRWENFVYDEAQHGVRVIPGGRSGRKKGRGVSTENYPVNKSAKDSADVFLTAAADAIAEVQHAGKAAPPAAPAAGGEAKADAEVLTPMQRDILTLGEEIYRLAAALRQAHDSTAGRFLTVFESPVDFVIAMHGHMHGQMKDPERAEEALFDALSTSHQYLEAGVITFDDVLQDLSEADKVNIG